MPQYLLLVHGNAKSEASAEEWEKFFSLAQESGFFRGGSELGERIYVGDQNDIPSTDSIAGFVRFDAENQDALLALLENHPVVTHGGTVELCEMPLTAPPE